MALHPGSQQKCQAEIDEKIGSRSPTIEDVPNLPYVMASLMETQRLSIMAPASLPHYLTKVCTKSQLIKVKKRNFRHQTLHWLNSGKTIFFTDLVQQFPRLDTDGFEAKKRQYENWIKLC